MNPTRGALRLLLLWGLASSVVTGRDDDPLSRTVPVPADARIPASDFFRVPLLEMPRLNPSGTRMAALVALPDDQTGLLFVELDAPDKVKTIRGGLDLDVYTFDWLNDDRLLFNVSRDKIYATGMFVADARNLKNNYAIEQHSSTITLGMPVSAPTRPIVWVRANAYEAGTPDAGVLQIDAMKDLSMHETYIPGTRGTQDDSGLGTDGVAASVIKSFPKPPEGQTLNYLPSYDGELGFAITIMPDRAMKLFVYLNGRWQLSPAALDEIEIEAVGEKPGELLVQITEEEGKPRGLHRYNAITGDVGESIASDPDYDCDNFSVHRDLTTRRLLGVTYGARTQKTVWFDATRQHAQELLQTAFPGQIVIIVDADKTGNRFLVGVYSDRNSTSYYLLDLAKNTVGPIKTSRPWIDPARMRPMQIVAFKTRDGVQIEGYLTLPEGAAKEAPAPLVVMPHGGPWERDYWGWNPEVQFLASRGYAVFQPNYRGSTGYDWRFKPEDLQDFRKMHDDVTDGVKRVLRSGLVDPKRVAIMGGSFGGYLAMCGAAFEPDLYRCAITMAGVFDWEVLLTSERRDDNRVARYRYWAKRIGDPKNRGAYFDSISPLRHVEDVKIPVFVQHGKEDSVVSIEQSKRLIAELKRFGVNHVVRFDKQEGHGNQHLENQVELYTQIEEFLAANLGKAAPTAGVP